MLFSPVTEQKLSEPKTYFIDAKSITALEDGLIMIPFVNVNDHRDQFYGVSENGSWIQAIEQGQNEILINRNANLFISVAGRKALLELIPPQSADRGAVSSFLDAITAPEVPRKNVTPPEPKAVKVVAEKLTYAAAQLLLKFLHEEESRYFVGCGKIKNLIAVLIQEAKPGKSEEAKASHNETLKLFGAALTDFSYGQEYSLTHSNDKLIAAAVIRHLGTLVRDGNYPYSAIDLVKSIEQLVAAVANTNINERNTFEPALIDTLTKGMALLTKDWGTFTQEIAMCRNILVEKVKLSKPEVATFESCMEKSMARYMAEREAAEKARLEQEKQAREIAEKTRLAREAAEKEQRLKDAAEKARLEQEKQKMEAAEKERQAKEAAERAQRAKEAEQKARLEQEKRVREAAEKALLEKLERIKKRAEDAKRYKAENQEYLTKVTFFTGRGKERVHGSELQRLGEQDDAVVSGGNALTFAAAGGNEDL